MSSISLLTLDFDFLFEDLPGLKEELNIRKAVKVDLLFLRHFNLALGLLLQDKSSICLSFFQ